MKSCAFNLLWNGGPYSHIKQGVVVEKIKKVVNLNHCSKIAENVSELKFSVFKSSLRKVIWKPESLMNCKVYVVLSVLHFKVDKSFLVFHKHYIFIKTAAFVRAQILFDSVHTHTALNMEARRIIHRRAVITVIGLYVLIGHPDIKDPINSYKEKTIKNHSIWLLIATPKPVCACVRARVWERERNRYSIIERWISVPASCYRRCAVETLYVHLVFSESEESTRVFQMDAMSLQDLFNRLCIGSLFIKRT